MGNPAYATKVYLKNSIFDALNSLEQEKWLHEVNTSQSCYNYRIFKQNLNFEGYLNNLPFIHRVNFTKYRCKNNKLPVNKYRFNRTDVDRNCQLCNVNDLGDEFHYLFVCDSFKSDRKIYLQEYFYKKPNTLKMEELFNDHNRNTLINLCKFIRIILNQFK